MMLIYSLFSHTEFQTAIHRMIYLYIFLCMYFMKAKFHFAENR